MNGGQVQEPKLTTRIRPALKKSLLKRLVANFVPRHSLKYSWISYFQNRIGTPKNLWFDTSHDLFSLISYFDLRRSLIFGGHDLQDHLRLNRALRMESEHQKTYDLIPHMTHLHWFHILTFLEVVIEGRSDICVNISTWCMS